MAKGITLAIAADTAAFDHAVRRGIVDPLEGAVDALDDVARAGDTAGGKLDDAMRDAARSIDDVADAGGDVGDKLDDSMRDAQRSTDNLSDEMRTLKERIEDATRKTAKLGDEGRDAGRKYGDGIDRARDGVEDFRDEANSTARESAASFDGSAESIGDAFQEIAANAFGGFGPAGAVAGLAAAAGIGLAMAGFDDIARKQEESEARVDEWAAAFIEAGGRVLDSATYVAAANAILTDGEQYKTAQRNAELWGVSVETAVAAMTGQHAALAEAQRNVAAAAAEEAEAMEGVPYDDVGTNLANMNSQAAEAQRALNGVTGEMDLGAERAGIMSQYLRNLAETTAGASVEVDEFGDRVYSLPDGTTVYVDAETGQATNNVDAIERRLYGIPDATAEVRLSTASADAALNRWKNTRLTREVVLTPVVPRGMRLPT